MRVSRPVKCADLRVAGLDESVTQAELVAALTEAGGCPPDSCIAGRIRRGPSGLGTAWVSCPAVTAKKLVGVGRIKIDWVSARIEALMPRPLHCFRCLEVGYTRATCTSPVDRGDMCYRCGRPGHTAGACQAKPECPLCRDLGRPAGHRLGSAACAPPKRGKRRPGENSTPSAASTQLMTVEEETAEAIRTQASTSAVQEPPPKPQRPKRAASQPAANSMNEDRVEYQEMGALTVASFTALPDDAGATLEEAMDVGL